MRWTTVSSLSSVRRMVGVGSSHLAVSAPKSTKVTTVRNVATNSGQQNHSNDYEEVISTLNSLQSNWTVLERARRNPGVTSMKSLPQSVKYLARVGLVVDDLNQLNVIHVSGTKGKGSTCAFCESILRRYGYKTGFYSSPHIIAVRERIRINGEPLSEKAFCRYFWEVYNQLYEKRSGPDDMPPYFKFLTVMSFYVLIKEKVDVAIVEVGIGGQYDCTNVIRKPVVCGVSSLGLDHTAILGSSLSEIAWQKGGIFKPRIQAFTSPQDDEAMMVLEERAKEIGAQLFVAPSVEKHHWNGRPMLLGLAGNVQRTNAGLAVQLANAWLRFRNPSHELVNQNGEKNNDSVPLAPILDITNEMAEGLRNCRWPGRHQILRSGNVSYFLDGAHTPESSETCAEWFVDASKQEERNWSKSKPVKRILLFNSTGVRSSSSLLSHLRKCDIECAVFCPNIVSKSSDLPSDQKNVAVSEDQSLRRCQENREAWSQIDNKTTTVVFSTISDSLEWISTTFGSSSEEQPRIHLLVTGSLHLVGGVLSILDPELECGKNDDLSNGNGISVAHNC